MMPPWLLLLLVVSLTLAFGYQLFTHRYGWRVLGYWLVLFCALAGFEALSESAGWNVTRLGDLRLAPDLVGAAAAIAALWFLGV